MILSKVQREALKQMFNGRCAYCGCHLGERWHADHVESVRRINKWVSTGHGHGKFVFTGQYNSPENNRHDNLMPACIACNINKADSSLESWRNILARRIEVLNKNSSAYQFAKRYGLVKETGAPVIFYFETFKAEVAA